MSEYILSEDLAVWFGKKKKKKGSSQPKGPWVNICKKKKGGGHPPCGRKDADEGAYPVCRAAGVAGKMSQSEKDSACRRKREKEKKDPQTGKGQKPTRIKVKNYKKDKKNEVIDRLVNLVIESDKKNVVISEQLQYHLDNKISISENVYRYGSPKYFEVINEARELYKKGYGKWSNEDIEILESERGKFFIYNGERLPLDFPLLNEAEYQGRNVKLGKIMQGDTKKFKVYVKNPKGNVVKVNFGQGGDAKGGTMRIRKSNPQARKSFRARHNCDNPGPRHKARYWSCKKW